MRTVVPFAALLALAACGGGDNSGGGSAPSDTAAAAPAPAAVPPAAAPQAAPPAAGEAVTPDAGGKVITITMKTTQNGASGEYDPATVTAKKGDVLHFVADGAAAHNVSWPAADNANAAGLPAATQYVSVAGQAVDQKVTWGPGTYHFQCDVHAAMGMKGTLTVQ